MLPVRKPKSQEYRLVQDLRAINQITADVHPVVPNPYTLLTTIAETNVYFTVLDLKDAAFCIPINEQSQVCLPSSGKIQQQEENQLCWVALPQGFKNSTLFGNALAKELEQ